MASRKNATDFITALVAKYYNPRYKHKMTTKPYENPLRHYRQQYTRHEGEVAFQVLVEETDLHITACKNLSLEVAAYVTDLRGTLKSYCAFHPEFRDSLSPVVVPEHAALIIKRMAEAAELANVGPMAAVAGTISQMICEKFAYQSPELIVENGGDIYMMSSKPRIAGLLPDPNSDATIGIKLDDTDFPVSICASSATIGHSLSLGIGDLVAVRAKNGSLADACATAFCNLLKEPDDIERVTQEAMRLQEHGIEGVFVQCKDKVSIWGKMELAVV